MSMTDAFATNWLNHVFQNANIANVGDATGLRGSTATGNLYVSLHTAIPGEAGTQSTSEANYTGYARVAVVRSSAGWTVATDQVTNAAAVTFGLCTLGSSLVTHVGIGTDPSGAGNLLWYGSLGTSNQGPFTAKTDDTITIPAHTFSVNDNCAFYSAFGSTLPVGITEGTVYWVKTVSGNDITISTTQGGATLDITAVGSGDAFKVTTLNVTVNVTPSFAINQISLTLD